VKFLKLQPWARAALEGLTWLFLTFIVGFGIFWISMWCSMPSRGSPPGFTIVGVAMGIASLAFYGVPMGIVLKYLRGETVKDAMKGTAEPSPSYPEGRADVSPESAEARRSIKKI
jgi:hypothetical protein